MSGGEEGDMTLYEMVEAIYNKSGVSTNMELIWENTSESVSFAAQTIDVDMSSYKYCIITAKHMSSSGIHYSNCSAIFEVPEGDESTYFTLGTYHSSAYGYPYTRIVTATQTTLTFTLAYQLRSDGIGTSQYTAIPLRIWGIYDLTNSDMDDPEINYYMS